MAYKAKHTPAGYKRRGDYMGLAMHEYKHGSLHSFGGYDAKGKKKKGGKVVNRAQAIAIGLSMMRRKSGQDDHILGGGISGGHAGYGRSI
jgi:hypothetical protein